MENSNIVILGDCASNGNNCLGHIIFDDDTKNLTYSMQYHIYNEQEALKWFLEKRNKQKNPPAIKMADIRKIAGEQYNIHINAHAETIHEDYNLILMKWYANETGKESNTVDAIKYLRQQEKKYAWPAFVNGNVFSYCLNGNHFGNYLLQIKKHCTQHPKPDCVVITDYGIDHVFVNVKYHGQRYAAVMTDRYLHKPWDSSFPYPEEVYKLKTQTYIKERNNTQAWRNKKSRLYLKLLQSYLKKQDINTRYILLRHANRQFFTEYLDLTRFKVAWHNGLGDDEYAFPENSKIKFVTQQEIAKLVTDYIYK
jgi:hypothetical protein